MQNPVRTEERVSHHGQRWLHQGLQRDVSAASVSASAPGTSHFTLIVLLLTVFLSVQDAVPAGVKHLG